jgi:hypothetical protein
MLSNFPVDSRLRTGDLSKVLGCHFENASFKIQYVCTGIEFEPLLMSMKDEYGFKPSIASVQEHVPVVEHSIRVVKECC